MEGQMATPHVSKPFGGTGEQIEGLAHALRERLIKHLRLQPSGLDVDSFLRSVVKVFGGTIEVSNAPTPAEEPGGSLTIVATGQFVIRLSPYTSPIRDHFTIGHELGHYFLHYDHASPPPMPVSFHRYGSGPIETQANRFAAAFLMPRDEFIAKMTEFNHDTYAVAGYFGVSEPAVRIRASYVS
jgi:hypothetical protein